MLILNNDNKKLETTLFGFRILVLSFLKKQKTGNKNDTERTLNDYQVLLRFVACDCIFVFLISNL